jgi:hypothetical protein
LPGVLLEVVRRSMKIVACILGACVYSASRQHHISYMFEFVVSFSLSFFLVAETGAKYIVFFLRQSILFVGNTDVERIFAC